MRWQESQDEEGGELLQAAPRVPVITGPVQRLISCLTNPGPLTGSFKSNLALMPQFREQRR